MRPMAYVVLLATAGCGTETRSTQPAQTLT